MSTETINPLKELLHGMSYVSKLHEIYHNLIFTDRGFGRFAHIAGYLGGLVDSGNVQLANAMLDDLHGSFSRLNTYGGNIDLTKYEKSEGSLDKVQPVPAYKIVLGDDGTKHGFCVLWYACVGDTPSDKKNKLEMNSDVPSYKSVAKRYGRGSAGWPHTFWYVLNFNGGLLYHGPGGEETYSVALHPVKFWSLHT